MIMFYNLFEKKPTLSINYIKTNIYNLYTYLKYSKYSLFYESHKNQGYYVHAQTVSTRQLFGGEWPGDEAILL